MKKQKQQQSQIISFDSTNNQQVEDQSEENEQKKNIVIRQQVKISKQRRKRRVRLIGIPLIMRNILLSDSQPIYVYNLIKMMKRYDSDQLEQYKNFGIQSAGVGSIANIQLDKIHKFIDIELNMQSHGDQNFMHLIQLYKSYQDKDYYDLAIVLEQYQQHVYLQFDKNMSKLSRQEYSLPNEQTKIDEEFTEFERNVKNWANQTRENEIMIIVLGNMNVQKKYPQLKKQIFPQNLINFLGGDLQTIYDKIIYYKNFDFLTNFLKDFDEIEGIGMQEMERSKFFLSQSMKDLTEFDFELEDTILTFDGFKVPCKIKVELLFYDYKTKQISKNPGLHYFIINQFNFDLEAIQYLIRMRQQTQQSSIQILNQALQDSYDVINFEFMCYQEYFLEKFDYKKNES
ncbi:hypothetical protein ABPG74_009008 [Tetrahymena malaccensis]